MNSKGMQFPAPEIFSFQNMSNLYMNNYIDDLFKEVNGLFEYPDWLPIERFQLSFYCDKLRFLSKEFEHIPMKEVDCISEIPVYKNDRERWKSLRDNPPNLYHVEQQLVFELTEIYKASVPVKGLLFSWQKFSSELSFDRYNFEQHDGEVYVGFDEEAIILRQQLASITMKQLEVLSIVGMAGLGKTTLAKKLYNDPYIVSYFYVRAWVTCSQVYQKRDVLLALLSFVVELSDDVYMMDTNKLAHVLYCALKGRRYLIVIDDIWSIDAWDDFKRSFPNDNNGSKIMLTTRLKDVALHAQSNGNPLYLRFLTEEESFDLFRKRSFLKGSYFRELSYIGIDIVRKCRGLPLAIVVIAGLLKNNFDLEWWIHVEKSVRSYVVSDENQYMDTLALSYNHLPQHLRPCFLYFGVFPEDSDIPVRKLICFWIAEGLITKIGPKSLEDVAEEYLMDLIGRSLVVASKKGFNGAIITCRIHDLLRVLCLRKADEEIFSPKLCKCIKHFYSCAYCAVYEASSSNPPANTQVFLSPNVLDISSNCSCSSSELVQSFYESKSRIRYASKLITAMDLSSMELCIFPSELLQLVQLRYLELRFRYGNPPESISLLTKLQALVMSSRRNMVVPESIWKIINLRHLYIKSGENLVNFSLLEEESGLLENLHTMSLVSPTRPCERILARTPNLRKLGLCGPLTTKGGDYKCPDLALLMHLENLKLVNTIPLCKPGRLSSSFIFPGRLKSLTRSNTCFDWNEAWLFEMIPNLEVLKLKFHAFIGKDWETSPGLFPRLKFLKINELDIVTWTASSNHFPVLQRLNVDRCPYLMEIPADFGDICTLEWIDISGCSDTAVDSVRDIQKEQENNGNDWPKILINHGSLPSKNRERTGMKLLDAVRRHKTLSPLVIPDR